MIFGIGTDIVHITRMKKILDKYGDKFARRILTEEEFDGFLKRKDNANFLAKRFAAKEAVSKAMGTGFTGGLSFQHIGVSHDERGKPLLVYSGKAEEFICSEKICHSHLSLSDENEYAVAFVTLVSC